MPRGGRRRNAGRPKGRKNRNTLELEKSARAWGDLCIANLADLMENSKSEQVRIAAIGMLLDRGYGRSKTYDASDKEAGAVVVKISENDAAL